MKLKALNRITNEIYWRLEQVSEHAINEEDWWSSFVTADKQLNKKKLPEIPSTNVSNMEYVHLGFHRNHADNVNMEVTVRYTKYNAFFNNILLLM